MMKSTCSRPHRRHVLGFGLAAIAAPALVGRAFAQTPVSPESLLRPGASTMIKLRAWENYPTSELPGLARYLDAHPDLSIEWSSIPFARYRDSMIVEFIADERLDIVQIPETELAAWAEAGWIQDLTGRDGLDDLLRSVSPGAAEATRAHGQTFAAPFTGAALGFAYHLPTLEKAGFGAPAASFDELREQMVKIKAEGIHEYPLSLSLKKQPGQFWSIWGTLFASGGNLFDENNEPVFDVSGSELTAILEWYVAALNDWRIVSMDDIQREWGNTRTAIRGGEIPFGFMFDYAMYEFNVMPESNVKGQMRLGHLPSLNGGRAGTVGVFHSIGLASTAQNPDRA